PNLQDNLDKLRSYGKKIIEPATGMLACRDVGRGKMPEPEVLLQYILRTVAKEKDLVGKKVLVTAGPTQEAIDPVRYITNHSTGKMGYAIARDAMLRGADVTLITGPCAIEPPMFVRVCPVVSAQDMYEAVMKERQDADIIIMTAAVADYRPASASDEKIKKADGDLAIPLTRTQDILKTLGGSKREGQFLCGFSMETQNMLENSREKIGKKHLDMIVANNLKVAGAGFGTDTNVITIITPDAEKELPLMSKQEAAGCILDEIKDRIADPLF
ncbi:MAG: bifunctional phosphopantothenoylcysteine decarboxylase/phosphopantothenate--cysteine ligase CoaBC, partial [Clostridiales bacterium]|nr:bifunctional phosphopantothenoylcysteine decarboxylase/phosphopantothenate--cysteine ligase CoaBC [Clostridiales bacterium]